MSNPEAKSRSRIHNHHHRDHGPTEQCGSEGFTEQCVLSFKHAKMRVTKPRLAVIDCLAHSDVPLSPREIFERVKTQEFSEEVDQVSVYRIVETLSQLGLVHQIFPAGNYMRCHSGHGANCAHVTLCCQLCGKSSELELQTEFLSPLMKEISLQKHFKVSNSIFQMNGTCSECASASEPKPQRHDHSEE